MTYCALEFVEMRPLGVAKKRNSLKKLSCIKLGIQGGQKTGTLLYTLVIRTCVAGWSVTQHFIECPLTRRVPTETLPSIRPILDWLRSSLSGRTFCVVFGGSISLNYYDIGHKPCRPYWQPYHGHLNFAAIKQLIFTIFLT